MIGEVPTAEVSRFERELISAMRDQHGDLMTEIRDKQDLSDEIEEKLKAAITSFKSGFLQSVSA